MGLGERGDPIREEPMPASMSEKRTKPVIMSEGRSLCRTPCPRIGAYAKGRADWSAYIGPGPGPGPGPAVLLRDTGIPAIGTPARLDIVEPQPTKGMSVAK